MDNLERTGQQGLGNFWEQAMHTDPAILQAVMQGTSDAFPQDVAMSALMAQNKLRTAAQGKQQPMQPTVKQRMMASMAPMQQAPQAPQMQQAPQAPQMQQAPQAPLPEDTGIAQHYKGGSVGWAQGGILGFAEGDLVPGTGVPADYMSLYAAAGQKYGVDPSLLVAQGMQENPKFDPTLVNPSGNEAHFGLGQHSIKTWMGLGYDPSQMYDPATQIDAQAKLLSQGINHAGTIQGGLTEYIAGTKGVRGPVTAKYAPTIMSNFQKIGSAVDPIFAALTGSTSAQAEQTPPSTPAQAEQTPPSTSQPDQASLNAQPIQAGPGSFTDYFNQLGTAPGPQNLADYKGRLHLASLTAPLIQAGLGSIPEAQKPSAMDYLDQLAWAPGPQNLADYKDRLHLTNLNTPLIQAGAVQPPINPNGADPGVQPPVNPNGPDPGVQAEAQHPGAADYYDNYIKNWLVQQTAAQAQALEQGKGIAALKAAAEISKPGQPGGLLSGLARGAGAAGEVAGQVSQEQFLRDKEAGTVGLGALQNQGMMAYRNLALGLQNRKLDAASTAQAQTGASNDVKAWKSSLGPGAAVQITPAQEDAQYRMFLSQRLSALQAGYTMPQTPPVLPAGFSVSNTPPVGTPPLQLKTQ